MLAITDENARLIAGTYRSASQQGVRTDTTVTQKGAVFSLSSKVDGPYHTVIFKADVKDRHDRYAIEVRDVTHVAYVGDALVIESGMLSLRVPTVESLGPPPECPHRREIAYTYW